jgi:hypothetical protein
MKKTILLIVGFTLMISCNNKEEYERKIAAEKTREIDSINAARTKINEKIKLKNDKNLYKDLSGNHTFTMSSDGISTLKGVANFKNMGRDEYEISGSATSGKNTISIKGIGELITEPYLNFDGEITQNIAENGKPYTRKGKKTFQAKGNAQYWRLQDMVNGEGFVDYIDIHFK